MQTGALQPPFFLSMFVLQTEVAMIFYPDRWYYLDNLRWDCSYLCALRMIKECDMAKHKVYSVYDSKAQLWMQPIFKRADGEAVRAFTASIAHTGHQFADYPADYTLFGLGEFDDDTGRFSQYDVYTNLGNGIQFLPKKESE